MRQITQTKSRDEMIKLSLSFVETAKQIFVTGPNKKYTISINGDPCSGKSLIVDTFRACMFSGDNKIANPKERVISRYSGDIEGHKAQITMINARGAAPYSFYSELMIAVGRQIQTNPGFIFILNRDPRTLGQFYRPFPLPENILDIDVKFPEDVSPNWTAKHLGIKTSIPNTWTRSIEHSVCTRNHD